MRTLKFDNQPDRQRIASALGVDPFSFRLEQNPDGTWTLDIPPSALPDDLDSADFTAMAAGGAGDVDVVA